jgi:hypothetical protein
MLAFRDVGSSHIPDENRSPLSYGCSECSWNTCLSLSIYGDFSTVSTQRSSGADFEAGLFLGETVGVFMII